MQRSFFCIYLFYFIVVLVVVVLVVVVVVVVVVAVVVAVVVVVVVGYWLLNVVRFFDPCLQDGEVTCACIVGETTQAKKHRFHFLLRIRDTNRGKMKQIETVFSFSSA